MIIPAFRIPCLFQLMTGLYCPGCGGTRAVKALLAGHPVLSFLYHPLVLCTAVTAAVFAVSWGLYFLTGKEKFRMEPDDRYAYAAAEALAFCVLDFFAMEFLMESLLSNRQKSSL